MKDISEARKSITSGNPTSIHTDGKSTRALERLASYAQKQETPLKILDNGDLSSIAMAGIAQAGGHFLDFSFHPDRSSLEKESIEAAKEI